MDDDAIKRLLKIIEEQLGWGASETWASRDFEELNILILEKTKISLSASTLRRLWGKADYKNKPSLTTLDTLAQFAGYENWKRYAQQKQILTEIVPTRPFKLKRQWLVIAGMIALFAAVFFAAFALLRKSGNTLNITDYTFTCRPITHDLPNTVVFTYNAQSAPTDSVFIQQSWDGTKKKLVSKNEQLFNSIYYKPGFYHAKLTIGKQVVKEHPLLIPTNGWLGLIDQQPIPVYLDQREYITPDGILLPASAMAKHHISLEPQPPTVEFYNTGNFKPVSIRDFIFSVEVKNDYKAGASRCQQINIMLYTNNIPISIPLSTSGCVAALNLLDGNKEFKGSNTNLSAFGVNPSNWVKITVNSTNGKINISINDKKAFEITISDNSAEILGMGFIFQGSAAIRRINLTSGNKKLFNSFN